MQDFRSKKEKKKYIEKLLFRFIDAIASKKKRLFTILATERV